MLSIHRYVFIFISSNLHSLSDEMVLEAHAASVGWKHHPTVCTDDVPKVPTVLVYYLASCNLPFQNKMNCVNWKDYQMRTSQISRTVTSVSGSFSKDKEVTAKYLQWTRQVLRVQLNEKNNGHLINTHALSVIGYPADIWNWPKEKTKVEAMDEAQQ